ALQEAGRKLGSYIRKKKKSGEEHKKKSYIEKYLPHIGIGLKDILNLNEKEEKAVLEILKEILEKTRNPKKENEDSEEVLENEDCEEVLENEDSEESLKNE
ncbi:MAG: hypothetical protein Q8Q35_02445, partial [Nanoarchaeota archaeon]|nr:hypothetical protein [Nanoarchaeota archaeon]